ncbi:MAG: ETX/MTX2 family pore-forming toxin [Snowella sp.]|nr:ETX/MTX2 family pore-forming toxin [Snowella sp.]
MYRRPVSRRPLETTKSLQWDSSFRIGVNTTFKVGVPGFGEGEVGLTVETEFSQGGSQSNQDTTTFDMTFPIDCPPKTKVQATALVQLGHLDVPYVATISRYLTDGKGNQSKYTYKIKGVFKGTYAFDLTYSLKEV